jgi:hypothetical protein
MSDNDCCERCGHENVNAKNYNIELRTTQLCFQCFVKTVETMIPCRVDESTETLFLVVANKSTKTCQSFFITEQDIYDFPLLTVLNHNTIKYGYYLVYRNDYYNYGEVESDVYDKLQDGESFSFETLNNILEWCPYINLKTGICKVFDVSDDNDDILKRFSSSPLSRDVDWPMENLKNQLFFGYRQLMYHVIRTANDPNDESRCLWTNYKKEKHNQVAGQWTMFSGIFDNVFPTPLLTIIGDYAILDDVDKLYQTRHMIESQIRELQHKVLTITTQYDFVVNNIPLTETQDKWSTRLHSLNV